MGFSRDNANRLWMTPWTVELPERFQAQSAQTFTPSCRNCFSAPLATQFRPSNSSLHEDSLKAQAAVLGSLMRFYEYQRDPGVDVLTEGRRHISIIKQLV